ncbi:hypothetical protein D3C72_1694870 [compost metagenome]
MQEAEFLRRILLSRALDHIGRAFLEALVSLTCGPVEIAVDQINHAVFVLGEIELLHRHRAIEQATAGHLADEQAHRAVLAAAVVATLHLGGEVRAIARREQAPIHFLQIALDLNIIGQITVGWLQQGPELIPRRDQRIERRLEAIQCQPRRGIEHALDVLPARNAPFLALAELHVGRVDAILDLLPDFLK